MRDLAVHFFDKMEMTVVKDIEHEDFLCKTIGCRPIASLEHFTDENMVSADVVEEILEHSRLRLEDIPEKLTSLSILPFNGQFSFSLRIKLRFLSPGSVLAWLRAPSTSLQVIGRLPGDATKI